MALSKTESPTKPTDSAAAPSLVRLKVLVFFAGAVLMGLEIAGSRVLAPYFGYSVFVWGSLIAIFLLAISVGNYLGGRLADERPSHLLLHSICVGVALWIFGLAIFAQALCELLVKSGFDQQSGPLVSSMMLFLLPSIGMGMVSPFAIRLATSSLDSVGKVSGSLYALSNVGSILGTMMTTFVLIPSVGLGWILKGLGGALLLVALATMPNVFGARNMPRTLSALIIAIALALCPELVKETLGATERVIERVSTPYHNIAVIEGYENGVNYRALKFDQYTESAISLKPPYKALAQYTDYFHLGLVLNPKIERAVFIGAGGGVGPRAFHMHNDKMEIDVVDIDPRVLELARKHFFLEDDPHIRTIAKDGRMFVRDAEKPYDCVILDAFTIGGRIPFHLVTKEFFTLCSERMTDDGVFVMNINSALEGPMAQIFRSTYRTLDEVFPHVYVFAKDSAGRPEDSTNILFVASKSKQRMTPNLWRAKASEHASASYIQGPQLRSMVERDLVETVPDVSAAPLFTDDYAPIETMPF